MTAGGGHRSVCPTLPRMSEFLTDDETVAYGRYAMAPTRAELEKVFFLDFTDRCCSDHGPELC
ncbi:MAG: hypothetical protein ACRDRT_12585 [Pseudonocardiaceae bacterium]